MIDLAALQSSPLLADGSVGNDLHGRCAGRAIPVEALNQEDPEAVRAVHEAYADAGAQLLRTNTAQANALALAAYGLADRAEALNNSASALARTALQSRGVVMGTLAPPPESLGTESLGIESLGTSVMGTPQCQRAYGEQIIYLTDTGVDFFLLEHFSRLGDAVQITDQIKRTSDAPVLAQLKLDATGRTAEGTSAGEAAAALVDAGADALGLSCAPGVGELAALAEALLRQGVPVSVMPGIRRQGRPAPYRGAPLLSPAAFAAALAPLGRMGVTILGGCCGVTPLHIRALAEALQSAS